MLKTVTGRIGVYKDEIFPSKAHSNSRLQTGYSMNSTPSRGGRPRKTVIEEDGSERRKRGRPPKKDQINRSNSKEMERKAKEANRRRVLRQRRIGSGAFIGPLDTTDVIRSDVGLPTVECRSCGARNFAKEWIGTKNRGHFSICCQNGDIVLPADRLLKEPPQFLLDLLEQQNERGKIFRQNIRQYNSALAFASLRVNIDKSVLGNGPYIFKVQGQVYHSIGATTDSYCKLYMVDCEEAMQMRLQRPENQTLNKDILSKFDTYIRENNALAKLFRKMSDVYDEETKSAKDQSRDVRDVFIAFNKDGSQDQRRYNLPQSDEVAAIYVGQDGEPNFNIDFTVSPFGKSLTRIPVTSSKIDAMVYPLFHIHGEAGWDFNIMRQGTGIRSRITMREFYCHRLAIRTFNIFHLGGKLFQQFVVDVAIRDENNKLMYIRNQQQSLRSEFYDGCMDYVSNTDISEHCDEEPAGKAVILPASFTGSPRNMSQNYQDSMAIVREFGKPTYFITMTANPAWPEIVACLKRGQSASDRPDIVSRVFNIKLNELMKDLTDGHVLGVPLGWTYTIEFQKRGLPHAHILIIMRSADNPRNPSEIDDVICAEIPDPDEQPGLYEVVSTCMTHGPCGSDNPKSACMVDGACSKNYPMPYVDETKLGENSFSTYRRRRNIFTITKTVRGIGQFTFDNSYIVPYNPYMTYKYNCHINVEHCASVKAVKYLYKYITKGPDCATVDVTGRSVRDEIHEHLDARYLGPQEACWKLFGFTMCSRSHAVERLAVHLPRKNFMTFRKGKLKDMDMGKAAKTTLTEYFEMNKPTHVVKGEEKENPDYDFTRTLLYQDMPYHFTWDKSKKQWKRRVNICTVVARMYNVSTLDRERFFLRMILLHVKAATSFDDLLTADGVKYGSFEDAAVALNLVSNDKESDACMAEAVLNLMPSQLRQIFILLCTVTEIGKPVELFEKYKKSMVEDFERNMSSKESTNKLLQVIDDGLRRAGMSCRTLGLPEPSSSIVELMDFHVSDANLTSDTLNEEQRDVFETIMAAINDPSKPQFYFINAHGGTGKTYLFSVLITELKNQRKVVLPVAFSGIAATLLEGGRTVHSRFKLPVPLLDTSVSYVRHDSKEADLIRSASLIIWDEAPMAPALSLSCVDKLLRELMNCNTIFGGKTVVMGGDFRQILPVVQGGGRVDIVNSCIKRTAQWKKVTQLSLTCNMRANKDQAEFSDWLLKLGDGSIETVFPPHGIAIPQHMIVDERIEDEIFGDELDPNDDVSSRVILCPTNDETFEMNLRVLAKMTGDVKIYTSLDEIVCDRPSDVDLFPLEFAHQQTPTGLPPHVLPLKVGAIVMLIKNINPAAGLCNGTRLKIVSMHDNYVTASIIDKHFQNIVAFPRMTLAPSDIGLPFKLKRKQLPLRLSFAMTINKAQGQTFGEVGLYLPSPVFSHGQLYVSFSRVRSASNIKVQINDTDQQGKFTSMKCTVTQNIVWPEIFDKPTTCDRIEPTLIESDTTPVPSPKRPNMRSVFQFGSPSQTQHTGLTQPTGSLSIADTTSIEIESLINVPEFNLIVHGSSIAASELRVLAGLSTERMISDEIVDSFMQLLSHEDGPLDVICLRSTLFTLALNHSLAFYNDDRIVSADIVIQPIVRNGHWTLAAFSSRDKTITIYDSFNRDSNAADAEMFKTLLTANTRIRIRRLRCTPSDVRVTQQRNTYDCGAYIMMFAHALTKGENVESLTISDAQLKTFRLRCAMSLLNKRVSL